MVNCILYILCVSMLSNTWLVSYVLFCTVDFCAFSIHNNCNIGVLTAEVCTHQLLL